MKEASLVVWTAVVAFIGGGFGTFVYLVLSSRSKRARHEQESGASEPLNP
ncbi:MAG: hypothetical protein IPL52_04760 [Flavobacteriales bacterium]|nr:hypothetical protein [Flavobacteriales bacterium]